MPHNTFVTYALRGDHGTGNAGMIGSFSKQLSPYNSNCNNTLWCVLRTLRQSAIRTQKRLTTVLHARSFIDWIETDTINARVYARWLLHVLRASVAFSRFFYCRGIGIENVLKGEPWGPNHHTPFFI
jgi:hypothetical protein